MSNKKTIILAFIFGIIGALLVSSIQNFIPKNNNDLIKEFYLVENAVHVSPHSIRKAMDKGDQKFILVDLRSQEEYEKEHIVGAVSIPAYKDKDTSDYGSVERIVGDFLKLPKDKNIIVYCYSMPCMTGRKIGLMLVDHGIYVKHLGIGWNEWKYDWTGWNHEHEWNITKAEDYIATGKDPGVPVLRVNSTVCSIDNQFGC